MSKLGRLALWANVLISLGFAVIGAIAYFGSPNYTDKPGKNLLDQPQKGEYALKAEELKTLVSNRDKAMTAYYEIEPAHAKLEKRIPYLSKWYEDRLESLRTGADKQPVQSLVYANGALQYDANGDPALGNVKSGDGKIVTGLLNRAQQDKEYKEKLESLEKIQQATNSQIEEQKKLTEEIGSGSGKGLRLQLAKIQESERRAKAEQEYLRPLLYNAVEEIKLLTARLQSLQARLGELSGASN